MSFHGPDAGASAVWIVSSAHVAIHQVGVSNQHLSCDSNRIVLMSVTALELALFVLCGRSYHVYSLSSSDIAIGVCRETAGIVSLCGGFTFCDLQGINCVLLSNCLSIDVFRTLHVRLQILIFLV